MPGIVGGPFRDLKWGGLSLYPAGEAEAEWKLSGFEYEHEMSSNQEPYSTAKSVIGYIQQECVFSPDEYNDYISLNDGTPRAGVATAPDGSIIQFNGAIDGEVNLANGRLTVRIAGKVSVQ